MSYSNLSSEDWDFDKKKDLNGEVKEILETLLEYL